MPYTSHPAHYTLHPPAFNWQRTSYSLKPFVLPLLPHCSLRAGFDHELVGLVSDAVKIPVIASSGAGQPSHFTDVFNATKCSAALAAGIFHRDEVTISQVKDHMKANAIPTRV